MGHRALAVLAVLLPLGLVSDWVAGVVGDTDRYVATVRPLAYDEPLKEAVATRLEQVAIAAIDPERQRDRLARLLRTDEANPLLRRGADALAGLVESSTEGLVRRVVQRVVRGPEFAALEAEGWLPAGEVEPLEASFGLVEAEDLSRVRQVYQVLDALGFWLPVAWLAAVVGTVAFARDRPEAVGWLAYGSLAGLLLVGLALLLLREHLLGSLTDPQEREIPRAVVSTVLADLRTLLRGAVVVVALVLGLSWLSGPSHTAARARSVGPAAVAVARRSDSAELVRGVAVPVVVVVALASLL